MTTTTQLTKRQWNVLTFIMSHYAKRGITPTHYEIRDGCGISSTSVVSDAINALQAHGLIRRQMDKSRTIVLQCGTVGLKV